MEDTPENRATIFVSYARVDKDFALRLAKDLRSAGLKIWIDQLDIQPGANWDDEIESALAVTETTLAILSPAAAASNHVKNEILYALDDGDQVVPVLYQPCQVPLVLKRLHYVDFTSAYDTALAELVGRLLARKGDKARPAPVDTEAGPATVGRAALRRGTLTLSRGLLAMGVLLVSLLAGAAVWWTTRSPAGWAEDSIPVAPPAPIAASSSSTNEDPPPAGSAERARVGAAPAAVSSSVRVEIRMAPPQAHLRRGSEDLGRGPVPLDVAAGESVTLEASAVGHLPTALELEVLSKDGRASALRVRSPGVSYDVAATGGPVSLQVGLHPLVTIVTPQPPAAPPPPPPSEDFCDDDPCGPPPPPRPSPKPKSSTKLGKKPPCKCPPTDPRCFCL